MDPITATIMMGVSMAASAAGALVQARGAAYTGEAQAQQALYQARVAKINEDIAKRNADYQRRVGEVEAQQSGLRSRFNIGLTRAMQAGHGLDLGYGTAPLVRAGQQMVAGHEQTLIRSNAAQRAYGHEVQAFGETTKGQLYRANAQTARDAAEFGVATSILGGVSSVAGKWAQASQVGMFGTPGRSPLFGT